MSENRQIPVDQHFTSIYPATEGLSQHMLRKLMFNALNWMEAENAFRELIPASLLQSLAFPTLKEALQFVHRPPREIAMSLLLDNKTLPQQRLVFEELLAHRISLLQVKQEFQAQKGVPLIEDKKTIKHAFSGRIYRFSLQKHKNE